VRPTPNRYLAAIATAALVAIAAHLARPVSAASNAKDRGAELFATVGCVHCHGPAGVGGGIGPDLQLVRRRKSAAEITTQIHDGKLAMPAFGNQLTDDQISDLVAFLRSKRPLVPIPPKPAPQPTPKPTTTDPDQ
jgi:mono/diheme cytochrome c family protein